MSTVIATSVLPDSTANDTLTIGATGDSVAIGGNLLTMNTMQDAGGNTIFVSDGSGTITSTGLLGALTHISSQTASAAASLSFTTGIDSTYDVYIFKFISMNPATNGDSLMVNFSSDSGSNYNMTKTTTAFSITTLPSALRTPLLAQHPLMADWLRSVQPLLLPLFPFWFGNQPTLIPYVQLGYSV